MSTLIVHHLNDSRSQRVLWLLEELNIPYEIKKYQRTSEMLAPKELAAVHPLGTAPVITDGDLVLAESGAIVEYLIGKYGNGAAQPPESGKWDNLFFVHYVEGTLMPLLVNKLIFTIVPERSPFLLRPILRVVFGSLIDRMVHPRLKTHATFIEEHLTKSGDWIAGGESPTSADFMMSFALDGWSSRYSEVLGPNTKAYIKRIHERPAYQRALEKGGEYQYSKLPF